MAAMCQLFDANDDEITCNRKYKRILHECNKIVSSTARITETLAFLSSDDNVAVRCRRLLLGMGDDDTFVPTWSDLYNARMHIDLDEPSIITCEPIEQDGHSYNNVRINLSTLVPSTTIKRGPTAQIKSNALTKSIDDMILSTIDSTSRVTGCETLASTYAKIKFDRRSHLQLFGLNWKSARSLQMVRCRIRELGYPTRKNIVRNLLQFCSDNNEYTVTAATAKAIFASAWSLDKKRPSSKLQQLDDDTQTDSDTQTGRMSKTMPPKKAPRRSVCPHDITTLSPTEGFDGTCEQEDDQTCMDTESESHESFLVWDVEKWMRDQLSSIQLVANADDISPTDPIYFTLQEYITCDRSFIQLIGDHLTNHSDQPLDKAIPELQLATKLQVSKSTTGAKQAGFTNNQRITTLSLRSTCKNQTDQVRCYPLVARFSNVFSKDTLSDIMSSLDTAAFIAGRGGRDGSYIRISTVDSPTFFQIGKHFYPSVPANAVEKDILQLVNNILLVQNQVIKCNNPRGAVAYLGGVNTLQIVVECMTRNSGYGRHSDYGGRLLNTTGSMELATSTNIRRENRLPFREEMQTYTIVLTTLPDADLCTHRLSFYDETNAEIIGSIDTCSNMMHVQLHGTQCSTHAITPVSGVHLGNNVRVVISCRRTFAISPHNLRSMYNGALKDKHIISRNDYMWKRIPSSILNCCEPTCVTAQQGEQPSLRVDADNCDGHKLDNKAPTPPLPTNRPIPPIKENRHPPSKLKLAVRDSYPNVSKQCFDQMGVHRVQSTQAAFPGNTWLFLHRGDVARKLIVDHGIIPSTTFKLKGSTLDAVFRLPSAIPNGRNDDGATHNNRKRLLLPLETIPMKSIQSFGNLTTSSKSHPANSGDHRTTTLLFLSKPYKNDILSVCNFIKQSQKWQTVYKQHSNHPSPADDLTFDKIRICGSGGSPGQTDTFALDITKVGKEDPRWTTPAPQAIVSSWQNRTFCQLHERRAVVAVFLDADAWAPFLDRANVSPNPCSGSATGGALFLGYFFFHYMTYGAMPDDELAAFWDVATDLSFALNGDSERQSFLEYSRFREELHLTFDLEPLFNTGSVLQTIATREEQSFYYKELVCECSDKFGARATSAAHCLHPIDDEFNDNPFQQTRAKTLKAVVRSGNAEFIDRFLGQQKCLNGDGEDDSVSDSEYPLHRLASCIKFRRSDATILETLQDLITHLICNMVACSLRYQGKCLHDEGNTIRCAPLPLTTLLPSIYRAHPMPFPIRSYDVMPLQLRACAMAMGVLDQERPFDRSQQCVSVDILFMSIINRFTGRPGVYGMFRHHTTDGCIGQVALLPKRGELRRFLKFVDEHELHKGLFSWHHINVIPEDIRFYWEVFRAFFEEVGDTLPNCLQKMLQPVPSGQRAHAVSKLNSHLCDILEKHKSNLRQRLSGTDHKLLFLSHQIICDLEEVYVEPFGHITENSIIAGHGGIQGIEVCSQFWRQDHFSARTNGNSNSEHGVVPHGSLEHILTFVRDQLQGQDEFNTALRNALGCALDDSGGVCVALNMRPLSLVDAEHFMCKLYLGVSKTLSSRSASSYPKCCIQGLHPTYVQVNGKNEVPWDDINVMPIMLDSVDSYKNLLRNKWLRSTPYIFLLLGEKDPMLSADTLSMETAASYQPRRQY